MNHSQIGLLSVYLKLRGSFDLLSFDLIGQSKQKYLSQVTREITPLRSRISTHTTKINKDHCVMNYIAGN